MTVIGSCKGNYRVDPGDLICVIKDGLIEGVPSQGYFAQEWYVDGCKQGTTSCEYLVRPADVGKSVVCQQIYVDEETGDRISLPASNRFPVGRWIRKNRPICTDCLRFA